MHDFLRGWIVGNFEPSLLKFDNIELAIKRYDSGYKDGAYYHKNSTTYMVVIEGVLKLNSTIYKKDDIVEIKTWETITMECIENVTAVVIKTPYVANDKYYTYTYL